MLLVLRVAVGLMRHVCLVNVCNSQRLHQSLICRIKTVLAEEMKFPWQLSFHLPDFEEECETADVC